MKRILKNIFMVVFHSRILLLCKSKGRNLFIGRRSQINKPRYISFSDNVRIGNDCRLSFYDYFNHTSYSPLLTFGENVYIGNHFTVLCADSVIIENEVLIGSYVLISSENHGTDPEDAQGYGKQSLVTKPVRVCKGVWIGEKVSILPGVTIGEKSIIGTGSVVTKDIPPYSIAAGVPAKVLKIYNFNKHCWETIDS